MLKFAVRIRVVTEPNDSGGQGFPGVQRRMCPSDGASSPSAALGAREAGLPGPARRGRGRRALCGDLGGESGAILRGGRGDGRAVEAHSVPLGRGATSEARACVPSPRWGDVDPARRVEPRVRGGMAGVTAGERFGEGGGGYGPRLVRRPGPSWLLLLGLVAPRSLPRPVALVPARRGVCVARARSCRSGGLFAVELLILFLILCGAACTVPGAPGRSLRDLARLCTGVARGVARGWHDCARPGQRGWHGATPRLCTGGGTGVARDGRATPYATPLNDLARARFRPPADADHPASRANATCSSCPS